jgi:DNA-binding transcriptional MerR regulator
MPDKSDSTLIKIGDFAKLAGTNLRTLRYYEELGLLEPAQRSSGGFRFYRQTDVNRLNMIRDLQELGLHLDRIRELMPARCSTDAHAILLGRIRDALREQDRLLQERIATLEHHRARIAVAIAKVSDCERCRHEPNSSNNFCEPCSVTGEPLPPKVSALF